MLDFKKNGKKTPHHFQSLAMKLSKGDVLPCYRRIGWLMFEDSAIAILLMSRLSYIYQGASLWINVAVSSWSGEFI